MTLGTTPAVRASIRALTAISFPNDTPHRSGDTSGARRGIGVDDVLSRVFDGAISLSLEPFELLGHRRIDDRSEIGTRHECRESVDLVTKLGARCELDFITGRRQGLDLLSWIWRFGRRLA